ncbi:MAG TPA: hypothetical protein PKI62_09200, partial [bacterium]|nr:hypothetical protein [bacterium]
GSFGHKKKGSAVLERCPFGIERRDSMLKTDLLKSVTSEPAHSTRTPRPPGSLQLFFLHIWF